MVALRFTNVSLYHFFRKMQLLASFFKRRIAAALKSCHTHSMKPFGLGGYIVIADIGACGMWCYYISYFLLLKLCW